MTCTYKGIQYEDHAIIANMDHFAGFGSDLRPMVNRMCMKCGQHWYGDAGVAVVEFTKAAWDRWICSEPS